MSLAGNLGDVSLVDLLQFLELPGRTGTIQLARDSEQASIGLYEGQIVRASAPSSKRLGAHLIARGVLTDEQLEHALGAQRSTPDAPLGALLVRHNAVSRLARRARAGCSGVRGSPQVAGALASTEPRPAATAAAPSPHDADQTLVLLSADVILDGRLRALLQREGRQLSRADPFHLPTPSASDCPPAVLLDIRLRPELIGHVRTLRRMQPSGPVIAIVTGSEPLAEVYAAGAGRQASHPWWSGWQRSDGSSTPPGALR